VVSILDYNHNNNHKTKIYTNYKKKKAHINYQDSFKTAKELVEKEDKRKY